MLDWKLRTRTPYEFLHFFLSRGCIFSSDKGTYKKISSDFNMHLRRFCEFVLELTLTDYDFVKFPAHVIAAAVIACSRRAIGITPRWNEELEELC